MKRYFDAVVVLGGYQDSLREAILRTKRRGGEPPADSLARLLILRRSAELAAFAPEAVAPVPMHWRRRLARGIDGPQILADRLGRELGLACVLRALRRRRFTELQRDLTPKERARNVRGAFALGDVSLAGARVALVDDILTTGATANEVAKTLKRGGVASVLVVVAGRADGHTNGEPE
jgi:ComF family protein